MKQSDPRRIRRAVIFDMDGVLIDSYQAHMEAWMRLGGQLGRPITEREFIPTFGRRNKEIFGALWPDVPDADIDRLAETKEATYREIVMACRPTMDGAVELLDALKAAGFLIAVGSSGPPENVEVAMRCLGKTHPFDAIVTGRDVTHGKPHPEVFLKAAEKLGIEPRCCAVVEDSLAGLEAAARAGMAPVGLTGTFARGPLSEKAALVVESLKELTPRRIAALIDRNRAAQKQGHGVPCR
jgi:beta-phosphoglucomutase